MAYYWIWKTLTSFKTSQILAQEPSIKQVFFLVDRKDLDMQTYDEFNKFEPECVDFTNSTYRLVKSIEDSTKPLIITTIQKWLMQLIILGIQN